MARPLPSPTVAPHAARDRLLTFEEAAAALHPDSRPVSHKTVYEYVGRGVKVRGFPERIRLRAVQTPARMCIRESDLAAFQARLEAARAAVRAAKRTGASCECRGSAPGTPVKAGDADTGRPTPHRFKRCRPEEVGTYPPPPAPPGAAGSPPLRLCGGTGARGAGVGRSLAPRPG
jgi:hypothetical protein